MASRIEYEARLRTLASRKTDFKWARNVTITLLAGLAVSILRLGKVDPNTLFVTWAFAGILFVTWESCAYAYRRFYVMPFEEYQRQADQIAGLEKELAVARAERMKVDERRALAGALRRQSEIAVNNFWAKHPATDNETDLWIERIRHWHEETLQIMAERGCTEAEIGSVRVLGNLTEFNPTNRRYTASGKVNQWLTMVDGYRRRLEVIIGRYDA